MLMGNRVRIRDRSDSRDLGFVNTVACSDSCLWNVSIEQSSGVNSGQLIVTDFTLGGSMCYRAMVPAYFHYYNQEADPGDTVVALPDGFVVVLKGQDNATLCKEISSGILEKRPG